MLIKTDRLDSMFSCNSVYMNMFIAALSMSTLKIIKTVIDRN